MVQEQKNKNKCAPHTVAAAALLQATIQKDGKGKIANAIRIQIDRKNFFLAPLTSCVKLEGSRRRRRRRAEKL